MGTQPRTPQPPYVQPGKQLPEDDLEQPGGRTPESEDLGEDHETYEDEFDREDEYKDDV